MVSTVPITTSMFPDLYDAMLRDWNPNLSQQQWQRAFVPRWDAGEDHFGYALTDGGRIVGMLGTLFSRRSVAGRTVRFCNLHAWRVQPDYRAKSLALLKPILALNDCIITDFTPSAGVVAITTRLGFSPLDSNVWVLPPIPSNGKTSRAEIQEISSLDEPQADRMQPVDCQIFQDHQGIDCGHMMVRVGDACCYVVYSRIAEQRLPYCLVHYLSDRPLFATHHAGIRRHLLSQTQSQFAVVEARQLEGVRVPLAFRASAQKKLYRGNDVAPGEIDTLYSEMVLFKHSPLPSLAQRLRATVKRCVPPAMRRYIGIGS